MYSIVLLCSLTFSLQQSVGGPHPFCHAVSFFCQPFSSPEAALLLVRTRDSRPLAGSDFLSVRTGREFALHSQLFRFVRLDSEDAQSNGQSVSRGIQMLDLPRGRDSWW